MPRVITRNKTARGKAVSCSKCSKPIEAGQRYHKWTFRYGGSRYQHSECGYPRQSQLTQSRMGDVYAALESVEDMVASEPDTWTVDDIVQGLNEAAETAREIGEEARSTADEHFGGGGPHAERADEMEQIADDIESAASDVEQVEQPDEGSEDSGALHDVNVDIEQDGRTRARCTVCGDSVDRDPAMSDQEWELVLLGFNDEHDPDEEPEADDDDPWFEQVRSIVQEISV